MISPGELDNLAFTYYRRLGRVREYLEEHISEQLSLEEAARVAGLEKKYFSTFFHEKTGVRYRDGCVPLSVEKV